MSAAQRLPEHAAVPIVTTPRTHELTRLKGTVRWLFLIFTALATAFYVLRLATIYAADKLFRRFGVDWSMF
jgi:hypothetical protein